MWLPNRIFTAFRQQCLQKVAWIESFLNDNALTPEKVTEDKIETMVNQARAETAIAKSMTDRLLQLRKQKRRAEQEEQHNKTTTIGNAPSNPQPQTSRTDTIAHDGRAGKRAEIRPNGTIRYMYAVCDDEGRYCDNEVGRFEATIDNIILPENWPEWQEIIRDTGRAVANEMMN